MGTIFEFACKTKKLRNEHISIKTTFKEAICGKDKIKKMIIQQFYLSWFIFDWFIEYDCNVKRAIKINAWINKMSMYNNKSRYFHLVFSINRISNFHLDSAGC